MTDFKKASGRRHARSADEIIGNDGDFATLVQEAEDVMAGARLIRHARQAAELSQTELANRLGVSQPRISDLESGRGTEGVTYALLLRVIRACGFEPHFRFRRPDAEVAAVPASMQETEAVYLKLVGTDLLNMMDVVPLNWSALESHAQVYTVTEYETGLEEAVAMSPPTPTLSRR
ncbi:helix-turn-helix domain-containing protein [Azospirillum sp. B4]|uniref:helix-turn-helix domain-containing protein n=1 Tax=Azospirillum sp. B4 TaxID=95605 RepID=UPI00034D0912|nr:helix-turn-helix transcriptional regulator [Azospirillum sp. B4]